MKRRDLIRQLEQKGYKLVRNGSEHDIYAKGSSEIAVPRHKEINEITAKAILRKASI